MFFSRTPERVFVNFFFSLVYKNKNKKKLERFLKLLSRRDEINERSGGVAAGAARLSLSAKSFFRYNIVQGALM